MEIFSVLHCTYLVACIHFCDVCLLLLFSINPLTLGFTIWTRRIKKTKKKHLVPKQLENVTDLQTSLKVLYCVLDFQHVNIQAMQLRTESFFLYNVSVLQEIQNALCVGFDGCLMRSCPVTHKSETFTEYVTRMSSYSALLFITAYIA